MSQTTAYALGTKFLTKVDLQFKDLFIPKGTIGEILEQKDTDEYVVYFNQKDTPDHIECVQVIDSDEFDVFFNSIN